MAERRRRGSFISKARLSRASKLASLDPCLSQEAASPSIKGKESERRLEQMVGYEKKMIRINRETCCFSREAEISSYSLGLSVFMNRNHFELFNYLIIKMRSKNKFHFDTKTVSKSELHSINSSRRLLTNDVLSILLVELLIGALQYNLSLFQGEFLLFFVRKLSENFCFFCQKTGIFCFKCQYNFMLGAKDQGF